MQSAVLVMAKVPARGRVKTRLCPPLSPDEAAELAGCFLQDTLRSAAEAGGALIVAHHPPGGLASARRHAPPGVHWLLQRGVDLGERQEQAVAEAAEAGFAPVVLIGTDSPTLPPDRLTAALTLLETGAADAVLGPAADGGYYLLGLRKPAPGLLDGVPWGTEEVCRRVEDRIATRGLRPAHLPPWHDVDTPEDLRRLWEELCRSEAARVRARATEAWLRSRFPDHPLFR